MKILLKAMETEEDLTRFMKFCEAEGIGTIARNGNFLSLDMINFENGSINWGGYGSGFGVGPELFGYFKLAYPGGDPPRGQSFANVKMVISGKLSKLDEEQVTAKVEAKGGIVVSAVDETVNLLVVGKKPNAKLVKKAEALGQVVILDEKRFFALLPAPRKASGKRKAARAIPKTVDRKMLSNLKKLLISRDTDRIHQGIELLRSLESVDLYDYFLAGVSADEEGGLVPSSTFKGTGPAQPYLNLALLGLIAHAPKECEAAATLRKSVTNITMDLLSTESLAALPSLRSADLGGSKGLKTLEGLGGLKKLKTLVLSGCEALENVDGLSEATGLTRVILEDCGSITNVDGLASCEKLAHLDLNGCWKLDNIDGLSACTRLKSLHLRECIELTNVDGLSQHTIITELDLEGCQSLVNVDALARCTRLKRLNLDRCWSLESIEGLGNMKHLEDFALNGIVQNLDALSGCTSLTRVDLSGCEDLQDVSGIATCTKLKTVDLQGCSGIENVDGLAACKNLTSLDLNGCSVLKNIDGLAKCTKLTQLDLGSCESLGNLDGLAKCKNLQPSNTYSGFDLDFCHALGNVEGLVGCKKITQVSFCNSNRTSLPRGFEKLANLRKLWLVRNRSLVNVDELAGCEGLREVFLQDCESLTNVAGLVGCKKLAVLDLGGCKQVRPKPRRRELKTRGEVADYLGRVEKALVPSSPTPPAGKPAAKKKPIKKKVTKKKAAKKKSREKATRKKR